MTRAIACVSSGLAVLALVYGCGSNSSSPTTGDSTTGLAAEATCADEKRATPYSAGMSETTPSGIVVTIDDATPAPPREGSFQPPLPKYNAWTMSVHAGKADGGVPGSDGGARIAPGDLIPSATLKLRPYMPDHSHGSPINNRVKANGDGTFAVTDVDFSMPGFWQIYATVTVGSSAPETVIFPICVE